MKVLIITLLALVISACSSPSLMPEKDNVKISREAADKNCKLIGVIRGRTATTTGTAKEALEDLHQEAANKGANYVVIKQYSSNQTAVTGTAYHCP